MEEIDITEVSKRSIRGVLALTSRTFVIQIITFFANFLLTIFLTPAVFGVFFIVSAAIAFLSYFSDIGLAAALIQKKEPLTKDDLKTTFTIQQGLVIFLVALAIALSPQIGSFYKLEADGVLLFKALAVSFLISSLKTIPSIILERSLQFEKLVIPQVLETLVFSTVSLLLAISGFGITSFSFAVLARGITGLIAMYIISPWRMSIGFSKESASKLLSFGIPFQTNSLLALIKDDLLTIYLGKVLPLSQIGYIGFAQKWAFTPLRLIMDNVIRITFPSFSRLQGKKDLLSLALEKSVFASVFLVFPALIGLVILFPYLLEIIPKYSKWQPALLSLTFFCLNAAFSSISTPLTNALNAIGKIKLTLGLMVFWTVSTWVLTPIAVLSYGFNAVSIVAALVSTSLFLVVYIVRRNIKFNLFKVIIYPIVSSSIMAVFLYFLSTVFAKNLLSLVFMIVTGGVVYFGMMFLMAKREILSDLRLIKENLKR